MKKVKLSSLIEKPITGEWGSEGNSIPVLRTTNFSNQGRLNLKSIVYRNIDQKKVDNKKLKYGDIIIEKSGGSPTQPVGRVVYFDLEGVYLCNNFTSILRPKKDLIESKYLLYQLFSSHKFGYTNNYQNKTTGIINLKLDRYIKELEIPLPDLTTQQKIAKILDKADELRQYDEQLVEKYNFLTQSLFLEMFGDPVKNEKEWNLVPAEKHINLLTGFAFKSELYSQNPNHLKLCGGLIIMPWGIEWHKSNKWDIINSNNLDKYQLQEDDIVMAMDRPWIGSGFKIAQIKKEDLPTLLVQRTARIRSNSFNSKFLFHFYNSPRFKRHAKPTETTIPHISPKDINSYLLFDVPITLQNQFAERLQLIEAQKKQAQEALEKSEALFQSLLQKAFKGELN